MTTGEFTDIYTPLGEALYRTAFYMLESEQDAKDAVQDLYIKLWNSRDTLDSVHNPKAYCLTLMKNLCIDRIRKASRTAYSDDIGDIPADDESDRALKTRELADTVGKAMESLSDSQKTVFRLKVFEELSYDEISERTGMNKLTLRVLLSQARKKIRNLI